jgi:phosphonate transport system substrate-binding protein
MRHLMFSFLFLFLILLGSCTLKKDVLGSNKNPIKFQIVPSQDVKILSENSKRLQDYLESHTPYKFEVTIPSTFVSVVDALGSKKADMAAINTSGYYMAHKKFGVEARLTVIRHGLATYQSQFLARSDSKIKSLKDLNGKKIAFVDPSSTSGYLLPIKLMQDKKVVPKDVVFAMKHDAVVSKIYQGEVEAGATYYSPPQNGEIDDARRLVKAQFPDVEEKVRIVELSDPIPNDPIVFTKEMPEEIKEKISHTLQAFVLTPDGQKVLNSLLGATNLKKATDSDYDSVREMMRDLLQDNK